MLIQGDKLVSIWEWQRPQDDSIDGGKHRAIGAGAQRQIRMTANENEGERRIKRIAAFRLKETLSRKREA